MKLDFEPAAAITSCRTQIPDDEPMRVVTALLFSPISPANRHAASI